MSRYRATTRELLEQVRMYEGKMKDIYGMAFDGDSAETIAKKLKLDVETVKKVLGEEIALEKVERVPTGQYIVSYRTQDGTRKARVFDYRQHAHDFEKKLKSMGLKSEETLKEFNPDFGKDTKAGRTKETHADDKKTKDEDRIKSLENEIQRLKLELENEKNATVKPEPNPDTGEVPLTVGVAHKYLKDKQDKKEVKKEELEEATFSPAMISQMKKAYSNLKTITPANATKLNKILDTVTKDGLIDLYKAKIPFVSIGAGSKLSQKHNLSPMDIKRIISKEEVQESVKFKYALVDTSKDNEVVAMSSDEKDLKMSVHHRNRSFLKIVKLKKPTTKDIMVGYPLKEETELTEYFATVHSNKKPIADFIKKNKKGIDYVDDDAGGNIEFEGKSAHELADKVKAKFGVRVTKESFEPLEDKSLDEKVNMNVPMTVQYTYGRNPISFMQTLTGTKAGKKLRTVFPLKKGSGVYTLKGTGQDHIDFLKVLNNKGIMPKNKIIGEELEEDTNKYITEKIKGLENKAKKTGMPYGILKKVYDRGMAAWKGGHRPGATQQQWAFARVNSFVTKSSGTWGGADSDLAKKVRASEEVEESRQLKDPNKEMMVVKNNKVIVIDKSDWDKYKSKGYIQAEDTENEACWDTHKQVGFKMKGDNRVPNCVPKKEEIEESNFEITYTNPQFSKPKTMKIKARNEKEASSKFSSYGNPYKIQSVKKVQEELEETRQLTDPNKEMMVVKDGKVKVIDKSDWDKYKAKGYDMAESVQEADLTDKQIKMVRKVADKLPKDDFKKRYGKDAENVKFGTATNIVKKKLNIDGYEGARNLVDRLLKQEKGDE